MEIERIKNLVEKAGSGFLRIKKAMEKYELPIANIYFSKRLFEVSFKRPDLQINSYKRRVIDGKGFEYTENVPENVPENRLILIINIIKNNNRITISELSTRLSVNEKTIKRDLDKLKISGTIKRIGPDKGGHWEVIKL